jgi:predicted deacylase
MEVGNQREPGNNQNQPTWQQKNMNDSASPIEVRGTVVNPGERHRIELPIARLPTGTWMSMPIEILRGSKPGPAVWLSGAVHGDELNGIEIIRRVLERIDMESLSGTLFAVPIVNVFGFINQSRYLPDRRDLNRSFPGTAQGSIGSRIANIFMREVVAHCSHGIDLHTGSNHRTNLPQLRANLEDPETRDCALTFGAPVIINSQTRDGSLREAAAKLKKTVLLYEAGEPLRFDFPAIELGVEGVFRVLASLNVCQSETAAVSQVPIEIEKSRWIRARRSGMIQLKVSLGEFVSKSQAIATINDAFGDVLVKLTSTCSGIVIGFTNNPLVHQGDAVVHVAESKSPLN